MKQMIINGITYRSINEACRAFNMSYCCVRDRMKRGMTPEQALTIEVGYATKAKDHLGNIYPSTAAMARAYGIRPPMLFIRLNNNMSMEEALTKPVRVYKYKKKRGLTKND